MESLNETQIEEQISIYENKIKSIKENIRKELQVRRDLKAKIEESKKREATQVLILERLNEYEKIVFKQLEMVEKMEDHESLKQLAVIEKYEGMLREQQEVWAKYEEEYEKLPLAVEKQKAEIRLLQVHIKNKLIDYKIQETKRIIKMKAQIDKRREQLKIIELAKLYVEHKAREKRYCELANKVKNLKAKERELILEVQNKERQAKEKEKLNILVKKTSITPQLPKVDLSHFIIPTNKEDYFADSISINSYMLEQEYMVNNDDQVQVTKSSIVKQSDTTNSSEPKNDNKESNSSISSPMEIDNFAELRVSSKQSSNQSPKIPNSEQISACERRINCSPVSKKNRINEELLHQNQSNESLKNSTVERTNGHNSRQADCSSFVDRFDNEEMQMETNQSNHSLNTHNFKRINEQNARMSYSPFLNVSSTRDEQQSSYFTAVHQTTKMRNSEKVNENDKRSISNQYINKSTTDSQLDSKQFELKNTSQNQVNQNQAAKIDAAVPDFTKLVTDVPPTKIMKLSLQEQHQQQQIQHQQQHQQLYQKHQQQNQQHQQQHQQQQPKSPRKTLVSSNFHADFSSLPQSKTPQIISCERVNYPNLQMQPNEHKSSTKQDAFLMDVESSSSVTPMLKDNLNRSFPSTALSPSLNLVDPNIYGGDTISAILGSEITEPGGSFELARRLYEDSDLNSEDGSFDYEKMLGKFCSPIAKNTRTSQLLSEEPPKPVDNPISMNSNIETQRNSEKNEMNFVLGQFGKKQTNTSQRFF